MESLLLLLGLWILIGPLLAIAALLQVRSLREDIRAQRVVERRADSQSAPPEPKEPEETPDPTRAAGPPPRPKATAEERADDRLPEWEAVRPKRSEKAPARTSRDWEKLIAANWMVWIGGLTIALGGLLLVRFVWEAGLLNDAMRVGLGALFGGGLIAAAYRAETWALVKNGEGAVALLPSILVAAGVTVLNGAVYAAGALYGLVSPILALAGFIAVAAIAVALSLHFGRWVAALGFIGGYVGPLLTGGEDGSITLLMAYAAGLTAGALVLVRLRGWWQLLPITLIGAGFWGLAGITGDVPEFAVPLYALAITVAGLVFGEAPASVPIAIPFGPGARLKHLFRMNPASLLAAYLFAMLSGTFLIGALLTQSDQFPVLALMTFAGLSLFAGARRIGYSFIPLIGAGTSLLALLVWPHGEMSEIIAVAATALGFGAIGSLLALRNSPNIGLNAAAALTPAAALFIPISDPLKYVSGFWWGYGAVAVAVALTGVLGLIRKSSPDYKGVETQAAIYAIGASLAIALAPFAFLDGLWLGSALGVVALVIALIARRFPVGILGLCAQLAIAGSVAFLIRPWLIDQSTISTVPIFNELLFGFGIAIAAIAGAAFLAQSKSLQRAGIGGALVLGFTLIGLEIRHFAQGGDLYAPGISLGELSGYAIAYFGMAASLAWRLSKQSWLFRLIERVAFITGSLAVFIALFVVFDTQLGQIPIFNLLLPAIAMPALLLAGYAAVLRRTERSAQAYFEGCSAMALGFIWATFETRRALTLGDLSLSASGEGVWAYSVSWLAYAVLLLAWGAWRKRLTARIASLLILLATLIKIFLFDLSALEGAVRAASFIGFGLALIGIALFYQRYVFGGGSEDKAAAI